MESNRHLNYDRDHPLLTFGALADIQYADWPDRIDPTKHKTRYYRAALDQLRQAIATWNSSKVSFIVHLGDLLDGLNHREKTSDAALATVLKGFSEFQGYVYHALGNHDLYNFTRDRFLDEHLYARQTGPNDVACKESGYYVLKPHPNLWLIILDCYQISLLGYNKSHPFYKASEVILRANPNNDLTSSEGLEGPEQCLVCDNGECGKEQLLWLENILSEADKLDTNVIIAGHTPMLEASSCNADLCWDHRRVLDLIDTYANCILCYMAGHDHNGGYAYDTSGILHLTFPGVIELPPDQSAFATCELFAERFVINGYGIMEDFTIPLKHKITDMLSSS